MLLIIKRVAKDNIGDFYCNPKDYFDLGPTRTQDIHRDFKFKDISHVILGGGGMFYFVNQVKQLMKTSLPLICWSSGTNKHGVTELDYAGVDLSRFALLGLRDAGPNYLPCVSCMNPLIVPKEGYGVRCYQHKDERHLKELGFPTMSNDCQDLGKLINFLNGADTIITNTYHGWYWSVLLGKKVILYRPFSNKFYFLPYKVPVANDKDELIEILGSDIPAYPGALYECRDANERFYQQVKQITA